MRLLRLSNSPPSEDPSDGSKEGVGVVAIELDRIRGVGVLPPFIKKSRGITLNLCITKEFD